MFPDAERDRKEGNDGISSTLRRTTLSTRLVFVAVEAARQKRQTPCAFVTSFHITFHKAALLIHPVFPTLSSFPICNASLILMLSTATGSPIRVRTCTTQRALRVLVEGQRRRRRCAAFFNVGRPIHKTGGSRSERSEQRSGYVRVSLSLVATMQFFLSNSILQLIARSRSPSVRSHTR